MTTVAITSEQQGRLQGEVQRELEKREWAEPNDNVMAEYITVLIANGSTKDRVKTEMDDLVGSDFDPQFLDWLYDKASNIQRSAAPPSPSASTTQTSDAGPSTAAQPQTSRNVSGPLGGSRMLNSALADSQKRKADSDDGPRKRGGDAGLPTGPRAGGAGGGSGENRSLADRLGGRQRGPMQVRGQGNGRGGMNGMNGMGFGGPGPRGNFQGGFPQGMMGGPGFGPGFFPPGQQEMMAQMMMMQANMAQMGEMMARMAEEKATVPQVAPAAPTVAGVRPPKPPPKIPHGTKLGGHSVSGLQPKGATPGPIPDKPPSKALCRYSVGCSNSRCPYSHPSPVADEKTGMVLSEEACEQGKSCKDAECVKSHVSPAAALGDAAGPSRLLCKYQHCTNPACPFRHEDSNGNPIPPPALTAAKAAKEKKPAAAEAVPIMHPSSDNEDGDGDMEVVMTSKGLMDGALDDSKAQKACRYGERCTRPDCTFSHPASRVTPKSRGSFKSAFNRPALSGNGFGSAGGMNRSKKFGAAATQEQKLDPSAGAFVPGGGGAGANKDMEVTM